jgi:hypothetical protein
MARRGCRAWLVAGALLAAAPVAGQQVVVTPVSPTAAPSGSEAADRLRPSGGDKYAPKVDWSAVPPWRQTQFFGIRAQGQVFIYVVDCSGSMADGQRLIRAKAEIRRSVMELRWPQRFHVIFYNDRPLPMPGGLPRSADLPAKGQMIDWFRLVQPEGETDPRGAMRQALGLRPDAIFLLSDGEYPDGSVEAIAKMNPHKVPIHCIDLAGNAEGLKKIARDSGGQYVSRP